MKTLAFLMLIVGLVASPWPEKLNDVLDTNNVD